MYNWISKTVSAHEGETMKDLKLSSSKPPKEQLLIKLLDKEAKQTRKLAFSVLRKLPKSSRPLITIVFKSAVSKTKRGRFLADTRNELSRIRVCLHEVGSFLNNTEQ